MRLLRPLYLSCLVLGYFLLIAGPSLARAAPLHGPSSRPAGAPPVVRVLAFVADVNPVTAAYVRRGIELAQQDNDAMLVIRLDTPGGRLDSMLQITQDIVNSHVPVMVYVGPSGAGAASAGVFITYAAHVAVMAPGTTIGAAHPVMEGGSSQPAAQQTPNGTSEQELLRKVTNYSVAHLRNLADLRGRNADWAEKSIRESVAVTAEEAAKQHIVDYLAPSIGAALDLAEGRVVTVDNAKVTLHTRGATLLDTPMSSIESFLQLLSNSTLAYSLITLGGLALTAEVFNPGLVFPGVVGVIMLLLGLVALGMLPVNLTAVALIGFGFILFIADLFMTTHGILTAGGMAALVLGGLLLVDTSQGPGVPTVSPWSIAGVAGTIGVAFFFGIYKGVQARRRRPVTGLQSMVGKSAQVRDPLVPMGQVFVDGALWRAVSLAGPVPAGATVTINAVDGLTLSVRPLENAAAVEPSNTVPLTGT